MIRAWFYIFICILLTGCGQFNIGNMLFPRIEADVNDVYYGSFPDVPFPKDMKIDNSKSLVSVAPKGEKMGLLTLEGHVDLASLCTAMIYNMDKQGWILKGVVDGKRTVQIYKKKKRYAVLYIYPSTIMNIMEVWVFARLDDGIYQLRKPKEQPLENGKGLPLKYEEDSVIDSFESEMLIEENIDDAFTGGTSEEGEE